MATSGIQLVAQNTAEINQGIKDVIASLKSLEQQIAKNSKQVSLMDQVFGSSRGLKSFLKTVSTLDVNKVKAFSSAIRQLVAAGNLISSGNLSQAAGQLTGLVNAINGASAANISGITNLTTALNQILQIGTKNSNNFSQTVISLINGIAKISAAASGASASGLKNLGIQVSEFLNSVVGAFSTKNISALKSFASAAGAIKGISSLLNSLQGISKVNVSTADIKKIVVIFTQLAAAFKISAFALKFIPGGKQLGELSKALERIGFAFRAFKDLSGLDIDVEVVKRLAKALIGIIASVRLVSKFSGSPANLEALANALNAISRFFSNIAGADKTDASKLKDFDNKMFLFVKALRHLRGIPKDIPNIGGIIDNVSQTNKAKFGSAGVRFQLGFIDAITFGFASRIGEALFDSFSGGINEFLSGQKFKDLGDKLKTAGESILSGFGLQKLVGSSGFNLAAEFNDISNQFSVFAENLPIKEVQDFANQIGIKYPLSANQALQATLDLAKAGQGFASIKNILPTAADLSSVAESKDINRATQFLIAAEGSFAKFAEGVEANFNPENIKVAADTVFAAANVSTASVDSMTDALAKVGPAAAKMNLDLTTASAIITQFEDSNIRGVEAGTLLRTVLAGFQTDKAQDELNKLGVALSNSDGTFRNIGTEVIPDLVARYKELGLTQVQVADSIRQFGDVYAQQGLSILVSKNATTQIIGEMKKVLPVADAAQKMFQSFRGQVEQFRGSLETLVTKALSPLINRFFTPLVKLGTSVINFFLTLDQAIIDTAANALFLASAFATVVGSGLILTGVIFKLSGGIIGMTFAFAKALIQLPFLIIQFAAFTASVAASLAIVSTFALAFVAAGAIVTAAFSAVEGDIGGARVSFEKLRDTIFSVLAEIQRIAGTVFKGIGIILNNLAGDGSAVKNVFDTISGALGNLLTSLKTIDTEVIAKFLFTAKKAADDLLGSLSLLVEGFFGLFSGDEFAQDKIAEGLSGIKDIINNIFSGIDLNKILPIGDIISSALNSIGIELEDVIDIFNFTVSAIGQAIGLVASFVTTIVADLSPLLNIFGQLGQFIGNVVNLIGLLVNQEISIQTFAANIFHAFNNLISNIFGSVGQAIANIGKSIGSEFLVSIGESFANADFGKLTYTFLNELWTALYNAVRSIPDRLIELGSSIGSGLLRGIGVAIKTNDWGRVGALIADGIRRAFENVIRLMVSLGLSLLNSIFPKENIEAIGSEAGQTLVSSILKVMLSLIDPRTWAGILSGLADIIFQIVYQIATIPGNILIEIGRQIEGSFLSGILIALGNVINLLTAPIVFLVSILLKLGSALLSIVGAFVNFAEAFNTLAPGVKLAIVGLGLAIAQLQFGLFTKFIALVPTLMAAWIPAFLNATVGVQVFAIKAYKALAPIAAPLLAIVAALLLIKNVFNEAWRLFEGNILDFVVNVLGNFAFDILKIFGVDDETIDRLRGGLQVWVGIFNYILERIVQIVRQGIARLSIEINRVANRETVGIVEQKINVALDEKSAKETFNKITQIGVDAVKNNDGKTLAALGDQMVANAGKIVQSWKDLIASSEFKTLTDEEFKNAFSAVFSAGEGREAIRALEGDTESLLRIFKLLDESQNPKAVDAIKESYGEFTNQLATAELTTEQQQQALRILNQLVDGGKISTGAYNETLNKVFGDMREGNTVINEQGQEIGELKQHWEDLDDSIKKVSDTIDTTVSEQATIIGSFADNERKQAEKLQGLYKKLFDAVDFGQIAQEDADKYFDAVLTQMGIRRQSERDKLNPFRNQFNTSQTGQTYDITKDPAYQEFLKQIEQEPFEVPVQPVIQTPEMPGTGLDLSLDPDAVQQESEDVLKIREKFDKEEEELKESFAEKEAALNKEIAKDVQQYLRDKAQAERDFNIESIKREEDHQLALQKIDESGSEQLLDAVASRDGAAAQQAVKNRNKQIKEENSKFDLDEKRRKDEFELQQEDNKVKSELRRQEQLDQLLALQADRELKLRELSDERNAEIKKNTDIVAMTSQATRTQFEILSNFWRNSIQGMQGFAAGLGNQVSSVFSNIANSINGGLSAASSGVGAFVNSVVSTLQNSGVGRFVGNISNLFRNTALGGVVQAGDQALNNIVNGVTNALNTASNGQNLGSLAQGALGALGSGFLGSIFGGGRAAGGPLHPGKTHQILEGDAPEVARIDGKYFMMSPKGGNYVMPPKVSQNRSGGSRSAVINMNGWQISGTNAQEIASEIEGMIMTNINRELQTITGDR